MIYQGSNNGSHTQMPEYGTWIERNNQETQKIIMQARKTKVHDTNYKTGKNKIKNINQTPILLYYPAHLIFNQQCLVQKSWLQSTTTDSTLIYAFILFFLIFLDTFQNQKTRDTNDKVNVKRKEKKSNRF